jgi:hypothetical protein
MWTVFLSGWFQSNDLCLNGFDISYLRLVEELEGLRALEISYENGIQDDPQVAYQRSCKFLDVEDTAAEVQFSRTNPFPVHKLLENPDEDRKVLKGLIYEQS